MHCKSVQYEWTVIPRDAESLEERRRHFKILAWHSFYATIPASAWAHSDRRLSAPHPPAEFHFHAHIWSWLWITVSRDDKEKPFPTQVSLTSVGFAEVQSLAQGSRVIILVCHIVLHNTHFECSPLGMIHSWSGGGEHEQLYFCVITSQLQKM